MLDANAAASLLEKAADRPTRLQVKPARHLIAPEHDRHASGLQQWLLLETDRRRSLADTLYLAGFLPCRSRSGSRPLATPGTASDLNAARVHADFDGMASRSRSTVCLGLGRILQAELALPLRSRQVQQIHFHKPILGQLRFVGFLVRGAFAFAKAPHAERGVRGAGPHLNQFFDVNGSSLRVLRVVL